MTTFTERQPMSRRTAVILFLAVFMGMNILPDTFPITPAGTVEVQPAYVEAPHATFEAGRSCTDPAQGQVRVTYEWCDTDGCHARCVVRPLDEQKAY